MGAARVEGRDVGKEMPAPRASPEAGALARSPAGIVSRKAISATACEARGERRRNCIYQPRITRQIRASTSLYTSRTRLRCPRTPPGQTSSTSMTARQAAWLEGISTTSSPWASRRGASGAFSHCLMRTASASRCSLDTPLLDTPMSLCLAAHSAGRRRQRIRRRPPRQRRRQPGEVRYGHAP